MKSADFAAKAQAIVSANEAGNISDNDHAAAALIGAVYEVGSAILEKLEQMDEGQDVMIEYLGGIFRNR